MFSTILGQIVPANAEYIYDITTIEYTLKCKMQYLTPTWCKGVNQRHYAKLILPMSSSMFNKVKVKINEAGGHKVCQEMTALGWFNLEKEASFDETQQSTGHLFLLCSMFMQK